MFEDIDKKNNITDNFSDKNNEIITNPINSGVQEKYTEKIDHLKESIFSNTPKLKKNSKFNISKIIVFLVIFIIILGIGFLFYNGTLGKYYQIIKDKFIKENINSIEKNIEKEENNENNIINETENVSTSTDIGMEISTSTEQVFELEEISKMKALVDSDKDGLFDIYEEYYKTDKNNVDTDNDTYLDGSEVINGYNPNGSGKLNDNKNIFYFAYGSNMNLSTMKSRCGESNFVGFGNSVLNNYTFYFYGRSYANIKELDGGQVYGVLYKINNSCFKNLDRVEGYPSLYQRREVKIENDFGNFLAQVYIVENDNTKSNPTDSYFNTVMSGAEEYSLPESHINYIKSLK